MLCIGEGGHSVHPGQGKLDTHPALHLVSQLVLFHKTLHNSYAITVSNCVLTINYPTYGMCVLYVAARACLRDSAATNALPAPAMMTSPAYTPCFLSAPAA